MSVECVTFTFVQMPLGKVYVKLISYPGTRDVSGLPEIFGFEVEINLREGKCIIQLQKDVYLSSIDYAKAFDKIHNKELLDLLGNFDKCGKGIIRII